MSKSDLSEDELIALLSKKCDAAGGPSKWAQSVGISKQYVSDVLNRRTKPGETISRALGYERQVSYKRKDIWEQNK